MNQYECSDRDCFAYDIPVHHLIRNREGITLAWFDPMLTKATVNVSELDHLRDLNDYVLFYTQKAMFLEWLKAKEKVDEYVIAVLHDLETVDQTHECAQVYAILLVTSNQEMVRTDMIRHHYPKVVGLYEDRSSMLAKLEQVIVSVEHQIALNAGEIFRTFDQKGKVLRDLKHQLTPFLWWGLFKMTIKAMPHTLEARQELLDQCRSYYRGNQSQLARIDEFERDYHAGNAARWYTKSCFLFRSLNKALRTEDIGSLYIFRYFITDLCATLETAHREHTITRVYRGGKMRREEIENYSTGTVVAANGFLSTSLDLSVAQRFIGLDLITGKSPSRSREDEVQFVLFRIDIDWNVSPNVILADISDQSDFPDEKEILFELGSTFEFVEIYYDCEHCLWNIRMRPSTKGLRHHQEYEPHFLKRIAELTPTILFGILLADMGDYEQSATYFEHILAQMSHDHQDRPKIYYSVARTYRFTNQPGKALEFLLRAEQIQRAKLPESKFHLARTLAGIASVYYELQDYQQELLNYQESMTLFQQILPENHIEIARSYNRLGFAYINQKQYTRALESLSKALITYKNTLPSEHPGPASVLYNMGTIYHALGHTDESLDLHQKALKMREIILLPHHPYIAQSCYQLSMIYEELQRYDLALEYAQRVLAIYEKKSPQDQKLIREVEDIIGRLHNELTMQS